MKRPGPIRLVLGAGAAVVAVLGTTLGVAGAADSDPAPSAEIRGADRGEVIEGEYIVVLKDPGSAARSARPAARAESRAAVVRAEAKELLGPYDASAAHTYSAALEGFSVKLSEEDATELAADPSVAYVEPNRVERGDDTPSATAAPVWGLDRIDQRDLPLDGAYEADGDASDVTAYVIDSGIRISHDEFEGRASYGYNFVDGNTQASDCHGHGTHVAGTVGGKTYGVAKKVKLVGVKVLNCENSGATDGILAGYDWVAKNAKAPAVANVSIGGSPTDAKDEAVRKLVESGVTVTVSAGNKSTEACEQSPAREPSVITVASTTKDDERSEFSNYGDCVDLFAPGSGVQSAGHSSDTANATMNGTSMAAPHVTGVTALYVSANPEATPAEVTEALLAAVSKDKVKQPGSGSPNRLLYNRF
ncbi:S8 family peptidase [Streptomyces sp. XM4193]|uniref:S8 family peptidase n=1 Tax=Streptomyces sp. XM4193 TaxID=2929782 RepID=UPI001FF7A7BC|nr:S8 family peptidase [Streptomyces sp. XM4193]MCK1796732.1 S8 family peptidase [Streptomyces sp. XM4193]